MPVVLAILKVILNLAILHGILDGPQVCIGLRPVADLDIFFYELNQGITNIVVDIFMDIQALCGIAKLRIVLECPPEKLGSQSLGINIRQHNGRVVTAQLKRHPLDGF